MKKLLTIFLFAWFLIPDGISQDDKCAFVLREAEKLYSQGLIEEIPSMLSGCLKKGFTKEQELDAYKLIVLSHIFDDQEEKADSSMLDFLKRYPEYKIQPTDPVEFVYLFNSYRTLPVFNLGVNFGLDVSNVLVAQNFSALNQTSGTTEYFTAPGISLGLTTIWYISPRLSLGLDFNYKQVEYTTFDSAGFVQNNRTLEFNERQTYISSPLTLMYFFPSTGKLSPFLRLGGEAGYLLTSRGSVYLNYIDNSFNNDLSITDTDLLAMRNRFLYFASAGAGFRYNIKKGFFFFDAKYNFNINTQLKQANLYDFDELMYETGFLSDNFRLNNLAVSVGYVFSFYVPKKIK